MLPKFLMRMLKRGGYGPGFMQRFAVYDNDMRASLAKSSGRIWIHAVSVGEVFVALKYMEEMRSAGISDSFILTVTTSTGHGIAEKRLHSDDLLLYFPVDFPIVVRRALKTMAPKAIILTECELWPNMIRYAVGRGIPVCMINGRISESSFRGYRKLSIFTSRMLKMISLMQVQTEMDSERLLALGADPGKVKIVGSSKYDVVSIEPESEGRAWSTLGACGMGRDNIILVGGSTWPGEEAALLRSFVSLKSKCPSLKLVLVPRHAERRAEVQAEIERHKLSFVKKSTMIDGSSEDVDVLLADTTGELMDLYSCASVIFVGKSLTEHGGQNFIEPAYYGKPVITGPNLENFPVVAQDFISSEAIIQVDSEESLRNELSRLIADSDLRDQYGQSARRVVEANRGSVSRNVEALKKALSTA
jgi:3-deoxy-D-manno-octulosonic-acid transferase